MGHIAEGDQVARVHGPPAGGFFDGGSGVDVVHRLDNWRELFMGIITRKRLVGVVMAAAFTIGLGSTAGAGALPEGCEKVQGQVTCTTFDGPGKNQAGVGETTVTETQGNTTNKSPEPQDLDDSESCNPSSSQGRPCNP